MIIALQDAKNEPQQITLGKNILNRLNLLPDGSNETQTYRNIIRKDFNFGG